MLQRPNRVERRMLPKSRRAKEAMRRAHVLSVEEAVESARSLHHQGKTIVLAGGCFDVLHVGHVTFLEKAKVEGDVLFVFLESDAAVRIRKGERRPINPQQDRASVLAALRAVDYVVLLPFIPENEGYDKIVRAIRPETIATIEGDLERHHKERQATMTGARLAFVTDRIRNISSSRVIEALGGRANK